jgi:tRNA (cytidine/uridine-2'-O-)-methyltransferase
MRELLKLQQTGHLEKVVWLKISLKGMVISMKLNIVLVEPQIPQNAGNVMSDRYLKRSGMDYWEGIEFQHYNSFEEFRAQNTGRCWFFTTKAKVLYTNIEFQKNDFFVFGPESRGLPSEILGANSDFCVKIPMKDGARSLNLANSVSIAAYEAIRQFGGIN